MIGYVVTWEIIHGICAGVITKYYGNNYYWAENKEGKGVKIHASSFKTIRRQTNRKPNSKPVTEEKKVEYEQDTIPF